MSGTQSRLTVRVDFGADRALGPGKILLLEAIAASGSISQAGRALGMSYRRAWLLVDDMNQCFRHPLVVAQPGGAQGGGATVTPFGRDIVADYRAIEAEASKVTHPKIAKLESVLRAGAKRGAKIQKTSIKRGLRRPSSRET